MAITPITSHLCSIRMVPKLTTKTISERSSKTTMMTTLTMTFPPQRKTNHQKARSKIARRARSRRRGKGTCIRGPRILQTAGSNTEATLPAQVPSWTGLHPKTCTTSAPPSTTTASAMRGRASRIAIRTWMSIRPIHRSNRWRYHHILQ